MSGEPSRGPQVVILSGVSGSGKSTALRALEDLGFYCVDNLPILFLEKLLELSGHTAGEVSRIALGVDAREGRFLADAPRVIQEVRQQGNEVQVLFLDASDDALVRRYSETRRRHPLAGVRARSPTGSPRSGWRSPSSSRSPTRSSTRPPSTCTS